MTHRKDVVTFEEIMANVDQIPKGDPFARGRGHVDPLRERAMADALAAPQLAARVRELEAECDGYVRSHAILRAIHGALTDALPNTPIPALDSFDVVEMVRGLATECTALRRELAALMDDH